jgi:hypothetical protein
MDYTSFHTLLFHMQNVSLRRDWLVGISVALVELVLELHPMKSKRMQEAFHSIHAHQDSKGHPHEHIEHNWHLNKLRITKNIDWYPEPAEKPLSRVLLKKTFASWE